MCPPSRPSLDHYNHNPQVKPHFAQTPCLTPMPRGNRYNIAPGNSVADAVKSDIAKLYRKHNLKPCPHHGLYWAGLKKDTENKDRDLTMILVIALIHTELHRWRELDDQAREILSKYDLKVTMAFATTSTSTGAILSICLPRVRVTWIKLPGHR